MPRNDCQVLQDHKFRLELPSGHGLRHVGPKTIVLVSGHLFGTVVHRCTLQIPRRPQSISFPPRSYLLHSRARLRPPSVSLSITPRFLLQDEDDDEDEERRGGRGRSEFRNILRRRGRKAVQQARRTDGRRLVGWWAAGL